MSSIFSENASSSLKESEQVVSEWLERHLDLMVYLFKEVPKHATIIITSAKTITQHQSFLMDSFSYLPSEIQCASSYIHHHSDYLYAHPQTRFAPSILFHDIDPNTEEQTQPLAFQEEKPLYPFLKMTQSTPKTVYFYIETTKDIEKSGIQRSDNVYWFTFPSVNKEGEEVSSIQEVAALFLFGETRSKGFLSMLWMTHLPSITPFLENIHFKHLLEETIVEPFYMHTKITKYCFPVGFHYLSVNDNVQDTPKRQKSPIRRKTPSSMETSSPSKSPSPREMPSPDEEPEESEVTSENEETEVETPIPPVLPSPQRARLPQSPKRQMKKNKRKSKKPQMIENPETGRKIKVGGEKYQQLVRDGILKEE
jgi:hypothetical protein